MRRAAMVTTVVAAALTVLVVVALRVKPRETSQPVATTLAVAASRVTPGVVYYGVMQGDKQVGFASSTTDTVNGSIRVRDYFVADLPFGGTTHRASARVDAALTRGLRLSRFDFSLSTEGAPIHATGVAEGDSVLVLTTKAGSDNPSTQRIPMHGTVLLPTVVPIAIALGGEPKVGGEVRLPVFDPSSMSSRDFPFQVRAESVFAIPDSSRFDGETKQWSGAYVDSVHAWEIIAPAGGGFSGWVDTQGRIVTTSILGFTMRRLPYEIAFENWRLATRDHDVPADRDVLETTAIAANKHMDRRVSTLRVRLSGVDLAGFDLDGQRQRLSGDTLTIASEPPALLEAKYQLPAPKLDPANTRAEPLIQSRDSRIVSLARRIAAGASDPSDPRAVAQAINTWVHDSISDRITIGIPSALQVLQTRTGDCNEHTQLYVALARALGIPTRIAAGMAYLDGKFYYHAWPEVQLGDWVAVDPTFGQFPADAAHLRFVVGGITRQTELLRLMGALQIDVLSVGGTLRIPVSER